MYERNYQQDDIAANPLAMFLLGAAIGAVAALLYAPKSGRETRAQIADKANEVKDSAGEWGEKAIASAHDTVAQVAETTDQWKAKAVASAHDTLNRAAEAADDLKDKALSATHYTLDRASNSLQGASDKVGALSDRVGSKI